MYRITGIFPGFCKMHDAISIQMLFDSSPLTCVSFNICLFQHLYFSISQHLYTLPFVLSNLTRWQKMLRQITKYGRRKLFWNVILPNEVRCIFIDNLYLELEDILPFIDSMFEVRVYELVLILS